MIMCISRSAGSGDALQRMTLEQQYLDWRRQPAVGCMFARMIAVRPGHYHQELERLPTRATAQQTAAELATRVDVLIGDTAVSAAAILFPDIGTLEDLTKVLLALRSQPGWTVTTTTLQNPPAGEMVAIHISKQIPFGSGSCPSEALVLGPFMEFPPTRRAPISALEIYVGEPRPTDPKTGDPTTKANLAHMEMNFPTDTAFKKTWNKSVDGRLASLGGEDSRAKAKIAFVIPKALADKLGCAP